MSEKIWSDDAWEDYLYWQTQDKKTLKRINLLIKDIERNGAMNHEKNKEKLTILLHLSKKQIIFFVLHSIFRNFAPENKITEKTQSFFS